MRSFRRPALVLVFFLATFASLVAPRPSHAVTTFCYTVTGTYLFCRVCEFYGPAPNFPYLGYVESCFERTD